MVSIVSKSLALVVHTRPGESPERGTLLYVLSVTMLVIAGVFVAARISTRLLSPRSSAQGLGQDDICVMASLVASVGLSVTEIEATVHGYGNHIDDLTKDQIQEALEWFYAAQIMYKVVITLNKSALLLLYLRIFPHEWFRKMCFAGLAFIVLSGIAFIGVTIFQCAPVAFYWDRGLGGNCILSAPFWISYAIINIITDFYILCLPMPLLYKLTLSSRTKWWLIACFALGGFVCFTTIIRMTTLASSAEGIDFTYGPVPATNWSVIEANTGLICTCLPMLNLYRSTINRLLGRSSSTTPSEDYTANTPRSAAFKRGSHRLDTLNSSKDEIHGTGKQWGAAHSNIASERGGAGTDGNMTDTDTSINAEVDVTIYHTDMIEDVV